MPYLGSSPARGLVGTADIDDNAITLAKMASGTDGNLITYDASGDPAAVAVGTSGNFLKSQGAGSVPVFAAVSGLTDYGFYAQRTTNQSISANTWTKVTFDTEVYDPQSDYDHSSNYRFTPTSAGYYWCSLNVGISGTAGEAQMRISIYRNGSSFVLTNYNHGSSGYGVQNTVSAPILFNGSSDYIEGYVHHNGTGASNIDDCNFCGWKIGTS